MKVTVTVPRADVRQIKGYLAEMNASFAEWGGPQLTMEDLARRLGSYVGDALNAALDAGGSAASWHPEVRAHWQELRRLKGPQPRPFVDPDWTFPADASREQRRHYQRHVVEAVGLRHSSNTEGEFTGWHCLACRKTWTGPTPGERRRWWECPSGCNATRTKRRRVRLIREAIFGEGPGIPDMGVREETAEAVATVAGVTWRHHTEDEEQGTGLCFTCSKCGASWSGRSADEQSGLSFAHISGEWWCPRGCNRNREAAVAQRLRARGWVMREDKSGAWGSLRIDRSWRRPAETARKWIARYADRVWAQAWRERTARRKAQAAA